ncbi:MAG: tyrosine-type recombinase/integrase [Prevotella sp.]|jgi:integrase|nr:tyrosine-type recombinase/integrase [Prevotella sp.]
MVKLKFIIRDNALVLRISEGKQRYYKSVKHLLKGNPNIERHWNNDKERFSSYAVSCAENNQALDDFKRFYLSLIRENPELSAKQATQYYSASKQEVEPTIEKSAANKPDADLVEDFLKIVVEREKAKQGCNFEAYDKLHKKCKKILKGFSSLTFQSINYDKCLSIANTFAKHKGYKNTAKTFRNFLGKASDDANVNFKVSQIGGFKFSHYDPKINEIDTKKPDVLTPEQLKTFLNMDMDKITPAHRDRKRVELYHDFCVFMFHSFFAPCDVIKLKYKDIDRQGMIRVKRKKTHKPVEIPVNPVMAKIIDKYRGQTKNGYIFPIMDDEKEKGYETKDYLFKKFRERVNTWLKYVGKELGTDYALYAYVFRHTAITFALDNNIPISYVAMAAGTSIEMIQKHYYNGNNPQNTERLQQVFMCAAD